MPRIRHFVRRLRERWEGINPAFHDKETIFVHIPKAAGSAVSLTLFGEAVGHSTLTQLRDRDPDAVRRYFTFTFVREPLDRLQSAYFYLLRGGMSDVDRAFAEDHVIGFSFSDLVRRLSEEENLLRWWHFRPQHEFLLLDGEVGVDFVGRYENLEADFSQVAERIGSPDLVLPRLNIGQRRPLDIDSQTRRLVEKIYQRDFEWLGY